jgi:anti-anti-sigma factor
MTETFVVELKGVPLDVHLRVDEHNATLSRELALVHAADPDGAAPARLLWLTRELAERYEAFSAPPELTMADAAHGSTAMIDLRFEVPADAVEVVQGMGPLLDEVDEFCRNGELLTLVTPPESAAYRRWFYSEFAAQLRGEAPTPWSPALVEPEPDQPVDEDSGGSATIVIDDDLDLEGAAHFRGQIAAALDAGASHVTIDLTRCEFVDSVGISLLVTSLVRMRDLGGSLVVAGLVPRVRRTLETAGVLDELT